MDKKQAAKAGYGITGDIGGLKKRKYWTPDGREILQVPQIIETVNTKTKEPGERDGNLDRWLGSPPENPVPYCPHCDKWHDTEELVEECRERAEVRTRKFDKRAKRDLAKDGEIGELKEQMAEMQSMMKQILEGINVRPILQQPSGTSQENPEEPGSPEASV